MEQARQLQTYPEATLDDRLLYLDFLHQINSPEFISYLTQVTNRSSLGCRVLGSLVSVDERSEPEPCHA